MLEKLIEGISSWSDLEARIANLPTEIDRGNAFEEFCHGFFILDRVFQFTEVYCQKEIPPSVIKRLGYSSNVSHALSLILRSLDQERVCRVRTGSR